LCVWVGWADGPAYYLNEEDDDEFRPTEDHDDMEELRDDRSVHITRMASAARVYVCVCIYVYVCMYVCV
jgi:hypothetical protein